MNYLLPILMLALTLTGCKGVSNNKSVIEEEREYALECAPEYNAIYYWKTTFRLNKEERSFLEKNKIKRLYLRYFDVYMDADPHSKTIPVPQATVLFEDSVPADIEVVPTVFIDNNILYKHELTDYAKLIVDRILVMSETNDIKNVREVQLDCDWTKTTEENYFNFLASVKQLLLEHDIRLSSTIRLHQLTMKAPPVHRGALMCYNTGSITSSKTKNSILNSDDVALYAHNITKYSLPLDVAYPTFSWNVWFRSGKFQALLRNMDVSNRNVKLKHSNVYVVKKEFYQEGHQLKPGDEIRFEVSDYTEILKTKEMVEKQEKQEENFWVILYHLDANNLSKYTHDEIAEIYNR